MAAKSKSPSKAPRAAQALCKLASKYPGVEEGTSCNKISFKAKNKAFMYLGVKEDSWNLMLKLDSSYAEAEELAKQDPDSFSPGKGGWVQMYFGLKQTPPKGVLERWVDESYRLLAPKALLAELGPGRAAP